MTEKIQITRLDSIDAALGGVIQAAYDQLSPDNLPLGVKSFLARTPKKRVYRGRYETPIDFLGALRSYQKQKIKTISSGTSDGIEADIEREINQAKLPVIFYYRSMDYETVDPSQYPDTKPQVLFSEDGSGCRVSVSWLRLAYTVVFIAYDTESLDSLVLAWSSFMMGNRASNERTETGVGDKRGCTTNNIFPVEFSVCGESLPIDCKIEDPKTLIASHIPGEHQDGRIYACSVDLSVIAPTLSGNKVSTIDSIEVDYNLNPFL